MRQSCCRYNRCQIFDLEWEWLAIKRILKSVGTLKLEDLNVFESRNSTQWLLRLTEFEEVDCDCRPDWDGFRSGSTRYGGSKR